MQRLAYLSYSPDTLQVQETQNTKEQFRWKDNRAACHILADAEFSQYSLLNDVVMVQAWATPRQAKLLNKVRIAESDQTYHKYLCTVFNH